MAADLGDLTAFVAVAPASGFRDAARASGASASSLSEAVRRLEARLGVRLFNRTTRSVAPTEAGARLLDRLGPAGRSRRRARCDQHIPRPAGRHASAERAGRRGAPRFARHRAALPRRLSRTLPSK